MHDPQGIAWESFYTTGTATTYGEDADFAMQNGSACCAPVAEVIPVAIGKKECNNEVPRANVQFVRECSHKRRIRKY